jgi:hypothetical protein
MNFSIKLAVIFVCLAICAAGMLIIPGPSKTRERPVDRGTPVLLRDSQPVRGLRV